MDPPAASPPVEGIGNESFMSQMNAVFEERSDHILARAGRPEDLDQCITEHFGLDMDDLVGEIKHKLFGEAKKPRYLFTEQIYASTCGCYSRDELVKKAASETMSLQYSKAQLQRQFDGLEQRNKALVEAADTLKTAVAKLSIEWYMAKEGTARMHERTAQMYNDVSTFLFNQRQRSRLSNTFRDWYCTARGLRVATMEQQHEMMSAQHKEACRLLAAARRKSEALEVYASSRQTAAIKLQQRRRLWRCFSEWRNEAVMSHDANLELELREKEGELLTAKLALERTGKQRELSDGDNERLREAHGLVMEKLIAAQDRTAVAVSMLVNHSVLRSFLHRWWEAKIHRVEHVQKENAADIQTSLETQLSDTTQVAEHWKTVSDRYWVKIKTAAEKIGLKTKQSILQDKFRAWHSEVDRRKRADNVGQRTRATWNARQLRRSFMHWRTNASQITAHRCKLALDLAGDELEAARGAVTGWTMASAWLARHGQQEQLRLVLRQWIHNSSVLSALDMLESEQQARCAAEEHAENMQAMADNSVHVNKVIDRWSARHIARGHREAKRRVLRRWLLETQRAREARGVLGRMEKEVLRSARELQCALAELNELRMFKDIVASNAGGRQWIVKKGGGYQSMMDVVKAAQARLAKSTKATVLQIPGWDHAQKLAEFYGVDSNFISSQKHGGQKGLSPRAPSRPKKPSAATPRAKKSSASSVPRVARMASKPNQPRSRSAPPARPGRSQQQHHRALQWPEEALPAPLPSGVIATTAADAAWGRPSPLEATPYDSALLVGGSGSGAGVTYPNSYGYEDGDRDGDGRGDQVRLSYATVGPDSPGGPREYVFRPDSSPNR
eukprot:CAMPEP_0117683320 /NCGR_PEP_ID=MMETSP0804-20121206/20311_1 /TAXON_ID=1074897 /ORGANISM="Tetraselmis astigmatica, Strain CCMP880" /LENGTH=843 /DNA_ID=CAMNT_0005493853 /DNA_START=456 /DNA_END=2987 /DNA_ORIENTATION=-